jgi:hypothetical protein
MTGLLVGCFNIFLVGLTGDGRTNLATLTAVESLFSCELQGSTASLLGTGVMVTVRLTFDKELDLEVSVRQGKRESFWAGVLDDEDGSCCDDGVAPEEFGVVPAALEKKPRMLCCLPVEEPICLGPDRAGVRVAEADLPAILSEQYLCWRFSRGSGHRNTKYVERYKEMEAVDGAEGIVGERLCRGMNPQLLEMGASNCWSPM